MTHMIRLLLAAALCGSPLFAIKDAGDFGGHLYGTVQVKGGKFYEGFLRWGSEEAFWGDYFNSSKGKTAYSNYFPKEAPKEKKFTVFNYPLNVAIGVQRVFTARFGDIAEIEITGGKSANVTMKSGRVYAVEGYANDVGAEITILDDDFGMIQIPWRRIEKIVFKEVPAGAAHDRGQRLYGTVKTEDASFTGFIQWDKQECLTIDKLDGNTEDGRVSLLMGMVASVTKKSDKSCSVTLKDGRALTLRDNADVSHRNRGIYVEDPSFGRVLIPWSQFVGATFSTALSTGPAYRSYADNGDLSGRVKTVDGRTLRGRIVYDLDESEKWELLNGKKDGVSYDIPFTLITSIRPVDNGCRVGLVGGNELTIYGKTDVDRHNTGLLVWTAAEKEPLYLAWKEIELIEFQ